MDVKKVIYIKNNLNIVIKIPMDLIFKILHSEKQMPMLKFNPGKRRGDI